MPVPGAEQSWLKRSLLHIGGYYTRESQLIRGSKVLYSDIVEQATNKEFYKGAALSLDCSCAYRKFIAMSTQSYFFKAPLDGKDFPNHMWVYRASRLPPVRADVEEANLI